MSLDRGSHDTSKVQVLQLILVGQDKENEKNEKAEMQRQYDNSRKAWSRYLGLAEKGHKQSYEATKFRTVNVGNLSLKANSKDIQQSFEKQLSIKLDSVVTARDSTGKSRR